MFVTYILLLNVPPGPHKKMLKVIASSGIAGLSALANVVDGLPDLVGTHPPGKAVDGGPQLSHRGGGMTPELNLKVVPEPGPLADTGLAAKLAVLEDNLLHLSLSERAFWASH